VFAVFNLDLVILFFNSIRVVGGEAGGRFAMNKNSLIV